MSRFRALVGRHTDTPLRKTYLERDMVLGMATSGVFRGVEVFALSQRDLETLASSLPEGAMINRGVKHHAKALAEYFARKSGVVRLRADYRQPGQAERGIKALLAATAEQPRGRYFVGVPQPVFDDLWLRADENGEDAVVGKLRSDGGVSHEALQDLFSLHPELEIPVEVEQSYIGTNPVVRLVHYLIVLAANCDFPVLIEGETGTGKEIVARQIHALRFGVNGKCVCVNCGGIPSELLESELFGHVQGAFTSATRSKKGLWQDAEGGTLFLDEIGDMAPMHQVKVLRALEEGTFLPVGGIKPIRSHARVLSATHQNLDALVQSGRFREDLYHRLVVLRIRTPALREHPEDIPAIARHLWPGLRLNKSQDLSDDICELFRQQSFPGNVRELRSILSELAMLSYGKPITMRMARIVLRDRRRGVRDE